MPDEILTDEQALSVLNRMDAEYRAEMQMHATRAHVRGVILRYREVLEKLKPLEETRSALQNEAAKLESEIRSTRQKAQADLAAWHTQKKAELQHELDKLAKNLHAERNAAQAEQLKFDKLSKELKERTAALESEVLRLETRKAELDRLIAEIKAR